MKIYLKPEDYAGRALDGVEERMDAVDGLLADSIVLHWRPGTQPTVAMAAFHLLPAPKIVRLENFCKKFF